MGKEPDKTEKPTPKRIADARQDGNVLRSQEVTSVASVVAGVWLLLAFAMPATRAGFEDAMMICVANTDPIASWTHDDVVRSGRHALVAVGKMVLPTAMGVALIAMASVRLQVGHIFEMKPLRWRLDGLNPVTGSKRLLPTADNVMRLLLVMMKVSIIGGLAFVLVRGEFDRIVLLASGEIRDSLAWIQATALKLTMTILVLFIAIAAIDYVHQRKQYFDKLMMSLQEIRDEHRNTDGDPRVKARIRQKMRDMTAMRMITEVPRADVVITNPTHVAVALRYDPADGAPMIVAKGLRKRAQRIKAIAAASNVPMVESRPLARALYKTGTVGNLIPTQLFAAVAAVLAELHRRGKRDFLSHLATGVQR